MKTYKSEKKDKNVKNEKNNKGAELFSNTCFSEKLKQAWNEWNDYRKQIKKPLNKISKKSQIEFLQKYSEAEAVEIIMQSIRNGWQGLFELKNKSSKHSARPINDIQDTKPARVI